jgi:hypothetical protein
MSASWIMLILGASALAPAEVVHLNNGDVLHGVLVAANNKVVTLETPHGKLVIPKKDIQRIDYEGARATGSEASGDVPSNAAPVAPIASDRGVISLHLSGRSFWYAFESGSDNATDTRVRLSLYIGNVRACTFDDEKPDTVDGATLYNSFTFSPTDALLIDTRDGFQCSVLEAEKGDVSLRIDLPSSASSERQLIRMLYEVNRGDRSFERWVDVVSRSFSVEVGAGREAVVRVRQDASALEYTGFFKKSMKNLELFQINVLSTELKD